MRQFKNFHPIVKVEDLQVGDVYEYTDPILAGERYVVCLGHNEENIRNILNLNSLQFTCEHNNTEVRVIGRFEE